MDAIFRSHGIDLAAAAAELEAASGKPVTLAQMESCIEHEAREWDGSRAPSPAAWVAISKRLARADKAVAALTGLHQLTRQHHFAQTVAQDQGVEYIGITDYQASSIEDAIEMLIWDAHYALSDLREATTSQEGR